MLAPLPARAQSKAATTTPDPRTVHWDDGSLRAGNAMRLDPHFRVQSDLLLTENTDPDDDRFDWARRRIGIDGVLFTRFEFQVERELQDDSPWRDIYGDVRLSQAVRIRAGRFKVPFSTEQTTSAFDLDFLERAPSVSVLSSGRDLGVMVHGRLAHRSLKYEAGLFRSGEGLDLPTPDSRLRTAAGRVTFSPIRDEKDAFTRDLEFGAAIVRSEMPEGLYGAVGHSIGGDRFSEHMYVNGARMRVGVHGLWTAGRLTLRSELLQLTDQRLHQSITGEDLSNLITRGAYVSGVWRVAGKHGQKGPAVDVSARFDRLSFGTANQTDEAFTNPRADHVAPLSQRAWTFGATWIVNRYIKVQGNAIHEQIVDPLNVRDFLVTAPWTSLLRVQFGL